MASRRIEVELIGDASSLNRALGRATNTGSKFGSVMRGAVRGGAIVAGAAIAGLGIAAKIGFDEFKQSAQVNAQVAARLKSTGRAANVTAKEINDLSQAMLKKTGIDDEATRTAAAMLLSFRKVRNEAGKGNDIFTQATKIIGDVATAYNGGAVPSSEQMQKVTIQVGKALQDPIRGLTNLRRVGITFTKGQEETIRTMVESGHTMEAQKFILSELTKEFGGSAEAAGKTLPGQLQILKETFRDTAAEIIGRFLPTLLKIAQFVAPLILRALDGMGKLLDRLAPTFRRVAGAATSAWPRVVSALKSVWAFIQRFVVPIVQQLRAIFVASMQRIAAVVQSHGAEIHRIMARVGAALRAVAIVAIPLLRLAFVVILPRAIGIAITALDKITGAIAGVVHAIQALVSWIRTAYAWLTNITSRAWKISVSLPGVDGGLLHRLGLRQHGGPVMAGRPYVVGERRPEVFVPNSSGRILPRVPAMAGGGPIQVNLLLDRRILASVLVDIDQERARSNGGRGLFA